MRKAFLALGILGALCYFNAVNNPFVHDDVVFILQNPQVHQSASLSEIFSKKSFAPPSIAVANAYYRPFLDVVYCLEYAVFGDNPTGYHIVNILLHVLNACLLFMLTMRLTQRQGLSWVAAALFLVHPLQTEAVACISGISNLLFSFFLLFSFLLYMRIADRQDGQSWREEAVDYSAALFLFGCAVMCKEQAIVLPFLLLLYEFLFPNLAGKENTGWRLRLAGMGIVAGGYLLWRKLIIGGAATVFVANWEEFYLRLKAFPAIIMNHLQTVFFPTDLHYYRSYDILAPWVGPCLSFLLFILACILIWCILPQNRRPLFSFGLLWFALSILPTTSIVPLVHEYSFIAAFEHFMYLPVAGLLWSLLIFLDYVSDRLFHKHSPFVKKIFVTIAIVGCSLATCVQTKMWSAEIPLFEKAVKYENRMGRLHLLLAKAYYVNREYEKGKREYMISQNIMTEYLRKMRDERLRPFYEGFLKESLVGLAACEFAMGNWEGAQAALEKIVVFSPTDSGIENNLGFVAVQRKDWPNAVAHFEAAFAKDPKSVSSLTNLGVCYINAGQLDKAEESFRRALAIDPHFESAKKNLEELQKQKSGQ